MNGDLSLIVGPEKISIPAWHQVMSVVSPVFRKMLMPHRFVEGHKLQENGLLEVPLEDDNAEAMSILCHIFHHQTDKMVSGELSVNILAEIATLVDKYDCLQAVQPWPEIWLNWPCVQTEIRAISGMDLSGITLSDSSKWAHISFQLRWNSVFETCVQDIFYRATANDFTRGSMLLDFQRLPISLQGTIQNMREKCISSFHESCLRLVDELQAGHSCSRSEIASESGQEMSVSVEFFNCSSLLLGNALLALREDCGKHWDDRDTWCNSVNQHRETLYAVAQKLNGPGKVEHIDSHRRGNRRPDIHFDCSMAEKFREAVDNAFNAAFTALPSSIEGRQERTVSLKLP